MTIIVGVSDESGTWLASDRRITAGTTIAGQISKIVKANDYVAYGICGALRDLNVIRHLFVPPKVEFNVKKKEECEFYLVSAFVPELINTLASQKRVGTSGLDDADEEGFDFIRWCGSLLVAIGPNLYAISSDFAVIDMGKYGAIGSGEDFARAALENMEKSELTGDEKCCRAVQNASKFDTGCDNRVEIVKMR